MNTWKIIFATVVIFGAGVVTGGLVVRHAAMDRPSFRSQSAFGNRPVAIQSPGVTRLEFLRRAERDLNLTIDQREQIDRIISASQERTRKLMDPINPQLREELKRAKAEFASVLRAEQRVRFEQLLKQQRQQLRPRDQHRPIARPPESSSLPSPTAEPAPKP